MKPSPYRVREAVGSLDADPHECAFVGDSGTDVLAGRLAGVPVIGYANKLGKAAVLTRGPGRRRDLDLAEITTVLRGAPHACDAPTDPRHSSADCCAIGLEACRSHDGRLRTDLPISAR